MSSKLYKILDKGGIMKKKELNEILRLHEMWLNDEEGGKRADLRRANLQGANLRMADLREADLRGASLDFSCLPLWCGGAHFKADATLLRQLMAHACTLECDDEEWTELREAILPFAKKSHRAEDLGLLDKEKL